VRPDAPPRDFFDVSALSQEVDGPLSKFRGAVRLETTEMILWADEVDYNQQTRYFEARGNVHFKHFERNEELWASKVEYYTEEEKGKFYDVIGQTTMRIEARPGVLTSTSPFHFEGKWAERLGSRYVLHDGMITNCRMPRPWWTLRGPKFDIIPNDRALAYKAIFRVRKFPLFYTPFFYKSLERIPRRSGFLTPNIGHSSSRGMMFGAGYYWAINRSYDATYRAQFFTERGLAHHIEARGKPRPGTEFNAIFFGVQDRGAITDSIPELVTQPDGSEVLACPEGLSKSGNECRRKEGGFSILASGRSDLGHGFIARGKLDYLSSLPFRQAFTETFHEAIVSEVHSVGSITRQWSTYSLDLIFARIDNFQSAAKGDSIVIGKLPELQFSSRDRQISEKILPIWVSFESSAGLLRRSQPLFQTRRFTERTDVQPTITTALYWKGFHLVPSFSVRQTHYGERFESGRVENRDFNRGSRELFVDLVMPSLARVFKRKTFLGEQLKHVIEPRASFRTVGGVMDFDQIIRFDETELLSNTTEVEISLTNRLYTKRKGQVWEALSWELWQRRYFDPDFGGAVSAAGRNVLLSSIDLTPYAFLDRPRRYSPVVSVLRAAPIPGIGIEWRSDYDPLRGRIVNNTLSADARRGNFFLSGGHTQVHSDPDLLSPSANQFRSAIGFGQPNHRGWNAAFNTVYDFKQGAMQYAITQVTYNTDCCGLSFQYQRLNFGTQFRSEYRVAFAIANIGSFGTLKRQERIF
jgi:LPS-assembly protein